jgi:ABC-type transporter Mla subunit MlaD
MTTSTDTQSDSGRLSDAARNVAEQAEQTVEAKASTAMEQVSGAIGGVAHAIRRAGEDLRQEQPQLASAADTAAVQVDRVAEYLEQHEPREVFDAVQDVARRQRPS